MIQAYKEAGDKIPREEISMMEVHDCFSITEFVTYEDLHYPERGKALKDVMDGFYDLDGGVPCQVDGGLKIASPPHRRFRPADCSMRCICSSTAGRTNARLKIRNWG
ncbi:MAG: hypothetical protein R2875_01800 [Desulfobacterales bacterium]